MQKEIVIRGRLTAPTHVELDKPVTDLTANVEVTVRVSAADDGAGSQLDELLEFLRNLPPGTRSREDIDRQVREERDAWGDR